MTGHRAGANRFRKKQQTNTHTKKKTANSRIHKRGDARVQERQESSAHAKESDV